MNEFAGFDPLAWEEDGVVVRIAPRKPIRSRIQRQLTWAIATTLLGAASSLQATSVSLTAFGSVADIVPCQKPDDDPDLVPLDFWHQLTVGLKQLPVAPEPEGPDPDYFV